LLTSVEDNTARLTEAQREEYGITRRLPQTIEASLKALDADTILKEALAEDLVKNYIAMKEKEQEMLAKMSKEERRIWLIERY
jgi:glutamine synthetase